MWGLGVGVEGMGTRCGSGGAWGLGIGTRTSSRWCHFLLGLTTVGSDGHNDIYLTGVMVAPDHW